MLLWLLGLLLLLVEEGGLSLLWRGGGVGTWVPLASSARGGGTHALVGGLAGAGTGDGSHGRDLACPPSTAELPAAVVSYVGLEVEDTLRQRSFRGIKGCWEP